MAHSFAHIIRRIAAISIPIRSESCAPFIISFVTAAFPAMCGTHKRPLSRRHLIAVSRSAVLSQARAIQFGYILFPWMVRTCESPPYLRALLNSGYSAQASTSRPLPSITMFGQLNSVVSW